MWYIKASLLAILFAVSSLYAQTSAQDLNVVYQSPNNGDTYIPEQTTLLIRLEKSVIRGRSVSDFSFSVLGGESGLHSGKVFISDDNQTVIFKPTQPFTLGETVSATLSIANSGTIVPLSYKFRITTITDQDQLSYLNELRQIEEEQIIEFNKKISMKPHMDGGSDHEHIGDDHHRDSDPGSDRPDQDHPQGKSNNDPLGASTFTIDTLVTEKVSSGNMYIGQSASGVFTPLLTIIDNKGNSVLEHRSSGFGYSDFRPWANKKFSYFRIDSILLGSNNCGKGMILDSNYTIIDSFACGNGYIANDHEFRLLSNGHAIMIAYEVRDTDLSLVLNNPQACKRAKIFGGVIQELDSAKNVIFQWRTLDHLNISDAVDLSVQSCVYDYAHLNSVDVDKDGNLIASFRHLNEITKINRTDGKIIWRWGGKNNQFAFVDDTPPFSEQHDVRRIKNGHITMFDNGNIRKTQWGDGSFHDTSWSRAIEYNLDETNHLATVVWEYRNLPFSFAGGNVERLPNGNTFIGLGFINLPSAIEVTPEGEKVFQISNTQGSFNYRIHRLKYPNGRASVSSNHSANTLTFRSIFPNPAQTTSIVSFSAESAGTVQIEVQNILGQVLLSINKNVLIGGENSAALDVNHLSNGTYYCKISQNGQSITKAFIVQK